MVVVPAPYSFQDVLACVIEGFSGCFRNERQSSCLPAVVLLSHGKANTNIMCEKAWFIALLCCSHSLTHSLAVDLFLVSAGMGVPTVTAARILKGQLSGQSGEETLLEMDKFPFVSLAKVCQLLLYQPVWDNALILPSL